MMPCIALCRRPHVDTFRVYKLRRKVEHERCFKLARVSHAARLRSANAVDLVRDQIPVANENHLAAEFRAEAIDDALQSRLVAAVRVDDQKSRQSRPERAFADLG